MQILYVDESGDLSKMPADKAQHGNNQPVMVLGALVIDAANLSGITHDFLDLKRRWFPGLSYPSANHLDKILPEIKGADLRRSVLREGRNQRRHAIGFLDRLLDVLENHQARLVARVWIKGPGQPFKGRSIYTSSIQSLYRYFESYLIEKDDLGICIADSRDHLKNANVAHSIFTQKFRPQSMDYSRIIELPTFAHSENHAGIQICDIVCSSLLFPIAAEAYCTGHIANVHVNANAQVLRQRFGPRIEALQYRFKGPMGKWDGGVVVSDPS